ncbi:hypothetical protein IE81DRAFT_329622 [Ceraceosorus guamensis]|uniref:Uncharacterized protein n=1 Tax=Ceraceosorus guamensis TaxID=1522189 RepID=A0A316W062_9BASI|nr:hypothetical protein IE81DRAFT_329622 [Ceraceosorus guamensis]PWN43307.1 hypothetical protein IE81DRAFT_329622 [Ceraceosorus guamensis]
MANGHQSFIVCRSPWPATWKETITIEATAWHSGKATAHALKELSAPSTCSYIDEPSRDPSVLLSLPPVGTNLGARVKSHGHGVVAYAWRQERGADNRKVTHLAAIQKCEHTEGKRGGRGATAIDAAASTAAFGMLRSAAKGRLSVPAIVKSQLKTVNRLGSTPVFILGARSRSAAAGARLRSSAMDLMIHQQSRVILGSRRKVAVPPHAHLRGVHQAPRSGVSPAQESQVLCGSVDLASAPSHESSQTAAPRMRYVLTGTPPLRHIELVTNTRAGPTQIPRRRLSAARPTRESTRARTHTRTHVPYCNTNAPTCDELRGCKVRILDVLAGEQQQQDDKHIEERKKEWAIRITNGTHAAQEFVELGAGSSRHPTLDQASLRSRVGQVPDEWLTAAFGDLDNTRHWSGARASNVGRVLSGYANTRDSCSSLGLCSKVSTTWKLLLEARSEALADVKDSRESADEHFGLATWSAFATRCVVASHSSTHTPLLGRLSSKDLRGRLRLAGKVLPRAARLSDNLY